MPHRYVCREATDYRYSGFEVVMDGAYKVFLDLLDYERAFHHYDIEDVDIDVDEYPYAPVFIVFEGQEGFCVTYKICKDMPWEVAQDKLREAADRLAKEGDALFPALGLMLPDIMFDFAATEHLLYYGEGTLDMLEKTSWDCLLDGRCGSSVVERVRRTAEIIANNLKDPNREAELMEEMRAFRYLDLRPGLFGEMAKFLEPLDDVWGCSCVGDVLNYTAAMLVTIGMRGRR